MPSIFDPDPPPFINSAVASALRSFGYLFTTHGDNDFRFKLTIGSGECFRAQIRTAPESNLARFWVYATDSEYPEDRAFFVSQLAQLTTDTLVFGAFIQGPNGSVAYRDAELVTEPDAQLRIARLLNRCSWPMRLWTVSFGCWKLPKATASSALKPALMLEGCDSEAMDICDHGYGKLLTVEDGGGSGGSGPHTPNLSLI